MSLNEIFDVKEVYNKSFRVLTDDLFCMKENIFLFYEELEKLKQDADYPREKIIIAMETFFSYFQMFRPVYIKNIHPYYGILSLLDEVFFTIYKLYDLPMGNVFSKRNKEAKENAFYNFARKNYDEIDWVRMQDVVKKSGEKILTAAAIVANLAIENFKYSPTELMSQLMFEYSDFITLLEKQYTKRHREKRPVIFIKLPENLLLNNGDEINLIFENDYHQNNIVAKIIV